jgi:hypothetical protein
MNGNEFMGFAKRAASERQMDKEEISLHILPYLNECGLSYLFRFFLQTVLRLLRICRSNSAQLRSSSDQNRS